MPSPSPNSAGRKQRNRERTPRFSTNALPTRVRGKFRCQWGRSPGVGVADWSEWEEHPPTMHSSEYASWHWESCDANSSADLSTTRYPPSETSTIELDTSEVWLDTSEVLADTTEVLDVIGAFDGLRILEGTREEADGPQEEAWSPIRDKNQEFPDTCDSMQQGASCESASTDPAVDPARRKSWDCERGPIMGRLITRSEPPCSFKASMFFRDGSRSRFRATE